MKLPIEFEARMRELLGADYEAFEHCFDDPPVRGLRVNTLKMSVESFLSVCDFPVRPIPFCPEGFYFECDGIGHHPLHHSGAVYVQEPAAMAAAECCEIKPGMKILDICASPGGKTSQAAAKLCGKGFILSNEIIPDRCKILLQNVERLGIAPIIITNSDTGTLCDAVGELKFDLVIVDAPCSGEGMMRKNPRAVLEWSVENVQMCARRQREILDNAARAVAPGGKMIYSTCTFSLEENEMQIDDFLARHGDFYLLPVRCEKVRENTCDGVRFEGCRAENIEYCRRFYPHVSPGEGQFMALLCRSEDSEVSPPSEGGSEPKKSKKSRRDRGEKSTARGADIEIVRKFISDVLEEDIFSEGQFTLEEKKDGFYLVPNVPIPCGEVFSPGVKVGTVEKGRVLPHHRFFMAFGGKFKIKAELAPGDARVKAYIHGDVIATDAPSGFAAVTYMGATLGGGKISGGMLKNYYPKGLRDS